MMADEAARLVNSATFHPDWEIWAGPVTPYSIRVVFYVRTYNSSTPDSDGSYREKIVIGPDRLVSTRDLDDNGVLAAVLRAKADVQEHEDREFLRVRQGGRWAAPLHPHRPDGNAAWADAQRQIDTQPQQHPALYSR